MSVRPHSGLAQLRSTAGARRARETKPVAPESSARGGPNRSVQEVARFLANEVLNGIQDAPTAGASETDELLLERERGGYRVLIVRQHTPPLHPMSLSPRELEISRMVMKGYPNKMIAAVLEISSWTVGTHLRRIFAKLSVTSRAAMVARLMASGLLGSSGVLSERRRSAI
jgi:DNA-binding CsgD family transcriptional regulator